MATDDVTVDANCVVLFANSNSCSSSIAFANGVAQVSEPGDHLVVVELELAEANSTIDKTITVGNVATTIILTQHSQVELYLRDSSSGSCSSPCGLCHWFAVPETDVSPSTKGLTAVPYSIHGPELGSKKIVINQVVKVTKPCQQIVLYNASYEDVVTVKATNDSSTAPQVEVSGPMSTPDAIVLVGDACRVKVVQTVC